jgi:phage terminase large subunit GpA-like protein
MFHGLNIVDDNSWISNQINQLPSEKIALKLSEWAENKRSLPAELSTHYGKWDNDYAPFTVEIMDCLSVDSPWREIVVMKGGQTCLTTSVLENWIGYTIDHAPAPMLYLTGSEELAKSGIEIKVDRMLASTDLIHKIRSTVPGKTNKTGNTTSRKDFAGGFLLAYGGQSTKKLKSVTVQNLAIDELEEIPSFIGKQGDPIKLARVRQKGFDSKRKTLYLSTPTIVDGPIDRLFKLGDQRYFYVPCKFCGFMQRLQFRGTREDGKKYGIHYELDKDWVLIVESVEYRCENCLKGWNNIDKSDFLKAGDWKSTSKSRRRLLRSYQVSGMYSPPGNTSWESLVEDWLECWDPEHKRIFDVEALRVFQNTGIGEPFEERGESPNFETVRQHRRSIYMRNQIPNHAALRETGSCIQLVTAGVDIQKTWIGIEIRGWCKRGCFYSVDWRKLEGDTSDLQGEAWSALRKIIETENWIADDGKQYRLICTLIDAGYRTDFVYRFCSEYSQGVIAIQGRDSPVRNAKIELFNEYTRQGITAYNVTVSRYKDRLAAALRMDWNDGELQPSGRPNFPSDYGDDYFRQYEAEQKIHKKTPWGKSLGFVWKQKPNEPNHAWDCAVYNAANLDMVCYNINVIYLEQDRIDYEAFWEYISENKLFYSDN